ncbi:MAG: N-acetyltransferase, partial [Candidatus Omnitrophica bacterium]|nr:N-acetyltransferase [Candidatus Omnitrophota bacterium]
MIRKATLSDSKEIQQLINAWAKKGRLLERSLNYVYENIRDFWVYVQGQRIVGCCGLSVVGWEDLGEIKSLVVTKKMQSRGVGRQLVKKCIQEAAKLGVKNIFALTFVPEFFKKLGFKEIDRKELPHKIWSDCINCLSFPNCCEHAV